MNQQIPQVQFQLEAQSTFEQQALLQPDSAQISEGISQPIEFLFPNIPLFKCSQRNRAYAICSYYRCPEEDGLICDKIDCPCQIQHENCRCQSIKALCKRIKKKGGGFLFQQKFTCSAIQNQLEKLQTEIVLFKERLILTEKEHRLGVNLFGDEKNLFEALQNNDKKRINPELVSRGMRSMDSRLNQIIRNPYKKIINQAKQGVAQIAAHFKYPFQHDNLIFNLDKVHFSTQFRHQKIVGSLHKAHLSGSQTSLYSAVLLEPSLFYALLTTYMFKFKIHKCSSQTSLIFGICERQPTMNFNQNILQNLVCGAFTFEYKTHVGTREGHVERINTINSFDTGDVVEVLYKAIEKEVRVTNVTKNQQSIILIPVNMVDPLHVAVIMGRPQDSVDLIETSAS